MARNPNGSWLDTQNYYLISTIIGLINLLYGRKIVTQGKT